MPRRRSFRVRRLRLISLLVVGLVIAAVGGAAPAALGSGAATTLSADVVHNLDAATLLGPLAEGSPVTVGVVLTSPNAAAEETYLKQLYDPSSSTYQQFLDPDQFNTQFGVPAATVQATESWLSGAGLSVTTVEGATNYFLAQGTAAAVEAAFGVQLNRYAAGGRTFYANTVAPSVPAALPVSTVLGLNDLNRFHTPHVTATGTASTTSVPAPAAGGVPETGALSPQTLWSIYDLPSTNLGNGQSMAILGWGVTQGVVDDLRSFEGEFGLPQVPVSTAYYGATDTPDTNDGATIEWELDTQASTGMAPNVMSEKLYFAHHNTDADVLASIVGWVNDRHAPSQASASYGECENIPAGQAVIGTDGIEDPGNAVLRQAAIEGRTLFASTGDTGSSCPVLPTSTNGVASQAYPGIEYPAGSPYTVAVGGTVLNSDGGNPPKRFSETAWEFGGGGNSTVIKAPWYQEGVAPANCVTDASGTPYLPGTAPLCRGVPDVAAISGDVATGNGMLITDDNGADQQGAGTSLSSPLWLGMWTRIQAAARNKGLGFANPSLYRIGKSGRYAADFFDVTIGDNQPYDAHPGWDNTTGWGTPDVANLMRDLTGRTTPVHNTPPPVPAAAVPKVGSGGTLFTDASGDDLYGVQGQTLGAQGADPQLDLLSARMALTPDGKSLRTILTVRNLSTTIPTGGAENDYNVVWTLNGVQYFTQLSIEPGGVVQAYDGQVLHVSLETRYQQLHAATGVIVPGPNGTVEVDVPLANIGGVTAGQVLSQPSAQAYVREGLLAGPLEPVDSAGPNADYVVG